MDRALTNKFLKYADRLVASGETAEAVMECLLAHLGGPTAVVVEPNEPGEGCVDVTQTEDPDETESTVDETPETVEESPTEATEEE